ncbi:MAG: hypothetical protein ACPGSL_01585 [Vicingaceae bacterium]
MENKFEKIEFNEERDFSDTFSVSFKFLKQNFKPLFKTLIFLVGPFLLVSAVLNGVFTQNAFDVQALISGGASPLSMIGPVYFFTIIASIISGLVLIGVTFEYIVLYEEKGLGGFEVNDVWQAFIKDLSKIIGAFFGLMLLGITLVIAAGIIVGVFSLLGTAGGVIIGLLMFIGIIIIGFPLAFVFVAVYLIVIKEKIGFWKALSKTRFLLKDNFWTTWVNVFIAYLIVGIIGFIFVIPQSIVTGLVTFNTIQDGASDYSILLIVFTTIGVFGASLVNALLYIIMSFHYYSLNEQKQGVGLLSQINNIGADNSKDEDITI